MSLHYNGANSFVFINEVEIQKFKAKEPILSLQFHYAKENISNDFSVDNMKRLDYMDMSTIFVMIMMFLLMKIY